MFGNSYNNNSNNTNVNTSIKTFYCDASCLTIGYWNENLSVKMNPFLSKAEDGTRKYDFEKRINTAVNQEKAAALAQVITTDILPLLGKEVATPVSRGVKVGKDSALCVVYANDEKGIPSTYLYLYTGINADGVPNDSLGFKFNKTEVVKDYNPKNGSGVDSSVEGEFLVFHKKLDTLADVLGTAAHSVKSDNEKSSKYANNQGGSRPAPSQGSSYSAAYSNDAGSDGDLPWNN